MKVAAARDEFRNSLLISVMINRTSVNRDVSRKKVTAVR